MRSSEIDNIKNIPLEIQKLNYLEKGYKEKHFSQSVLFAIFVDFYSRR